MVDELAQIRKRKKLRKFSMSLALGLISVLVVWVFYFSNFLVVRKVSVLGDLQHATVEQILLAANVQPGTQLARLDANSISRDVTKLTAIGTVEVRRVWPSEVILAVTEKTPVLVEKAGTRWRLISSSGERFGIVDVRPADLLEVSVKRTDALPDAAQLAVSLPAVISKEVTRMYAITANDIRFDFKDGQKILWGNASDTARKAEVLQALLGVEADIYDVSAPDLPVTRTQAK